MILFLKYFIFILICFRSLFLLLIITNFNVTGPLISFEGGFFIFIFFNILRKILLYYVITVKYIISFLKTNDAFYGPLISTFIKNVLFPNFFQTLFWAELYSPRVPLLKFLPRISSDVTIWRSSL